MRMSPALCGLLPPVMEHGGPRVERPHPGPYESPWVRDAFGELTASEQAGLRGALVGYFCYQIKIKAAFKKLIN